MAGRVKVGPWGGNGGNARDIEGHPVYLTKIVICSGDVIVSLKFDYHDHDGKIVTVGPWGGQGGNCETIEFQPGEYLAEISGTTGPYSNVANLVRSLTFVTNKKTKYGPFGNVEGTPFSIPIAEGRAVAFFGRSGWNIDAVGIYLMPK